MKNYFTIILCVLFSFLSIMAQPKKHVVLEEGTGTWCGWCPRGNVISNEMHEEFGDQYIVIAVHASDVMENEEYKAACEFKRYPSANINRKYNDVSTSDWASTVTDEMNQVPVANISVETSFDPESRELTATVSAEFFENISDDYRLLALIAEDAVTGPSPSYDQSNYYSGGSQGEMGGYETFTGSVYSNMIAYNHVGRQLLSDYDGQEASLPSEINSDETHEYTFTYTLPEEWNEEYVYVIGMLIAPDKTIENAGKSIYVTGNDNGAPKFTSNPILTGVVNSEYRYDFYAVDPDNSELNIVAIELPSWLTLSDIEDVGNIHTTGFLSGLPTEEGVFLVTLSLSDGNSTVEQTFEIVIGPSLEKDWEIVGKESFSDLNASTNDIIFDQQGNCYILLTEGTEPAIHIYMRQPGGDWTLLGDPEIGNGYYSCIAIDSKSKPYIAYYQDKNVWVKKWDGSQWIDIGGPVSNGADISLAVDSEDTPFIAMRDRNSENHGIAYKFNGSTWEVLGGTRYSTASLSFGNQIRIDKDDNAYVLWFDYYNDKNLFLSKFDGTEWSIVGGSNIVAGCGYSNLSFVINDEEMFVAYQNSETSELMASKFDGASWELIGSNIANGPVDISEIAITSSGNPVVSYIDISYNNAISSMIYDGGNWSYLGKRGFSVSGGGYPKIAIFGETPFVSYCSDNGKDTAKQFGELVLSVDDIENTENIFLYPNPATQYINVEIDNPYNERVSIRIINLVGEEILRNTNISVQESSTCKLSISDIPSGIYFVITQIGSKLHYSKLIK